MPVKVVNLSDFAKELGAHNEAHLKKLHDATVAGLAKSIPDLVKASPVDTGQFAQSWMFEKKEWGAIIGNISPHGAVIEYGARPHYAPIAPLLAWAKRVLQDPSQPPEYSHEVWALAKGVQKKIAERGQQPQHILEKMIPVILQNIKDEYEHGQSDDKS